MKIYTNSLLKEQVKTFCQDIKVKKDFTWHYLYLISYIYVRPYVDRRYITTDFIPVNSSVLRNLVSQQEADNIIKNLLYWGIIVSDGKYTKGWKSRGFKITDRTDGQWKLEEVLDKRLASKIVEKMSTNFQNRINGYSIVNYWFNEVDLDYKSAKKWADNHLRTEETKFEAAVTSLALLKNKETRFVTIDDTSNRLHNNLTSLHRPLRKFISIDGEALSECDIRNSQPVFLAMVMKSRGVKDIQHYIDVVCSGNFYEYMAEVMGVETDLEDEDLRKSFKQKIFSGVLFDRNRKDLSKYEIAFQKSFPTVFKEIREMKKDDYRSVAISLQKMESKFIFTCVDEIDRQIGRGKAPLLTIHDSILSTDKYKFEVGRIMTEQFNKHFSINPKVKIN